MVLRIKKMKIIQLINEFTNNYNEIIKKNLHKLNIESKIRDVVEYYT